MPKNLRYWRVDGDHALIEMTSGDDYEVYLKGSIDWITHLSEKSWATRPVLDELREILKARGVSAQGAQVS